MWLLKPIKTLCKLNYNFYEKGRCNEMRPGTKIIKKIKKDLEIEIETMCDRIEILSNEIDVCAKRKLACDDALLRISGLGE